MAKKPNTGGDPLLATLIRAGFKGDGLRTAYAIAKRESGGRPEAFNGNTGTGDRSWGLFQINTLGPLIARVRQYGLSSEQDLLDPNVNAKVAYRMSKGGKDFGAWGIGPNAYRKMPPLDYSSFPGGGGPVGAGYPAPQSVGAPHTAAAVAPVAQKPAPVAPVAAPVAALAQPPKPDLQGMRTDALLALLAARRSGNRDRSPVLQILSQLSQARGGAR